MMDSLKGRTIMVTGATGGIGKQTALRLSEMGARVLLHDLNSRRLEETRQYLIEKYKSDDIGMYEADLSHFDEVKSMAEQINYKEGRLDVLINNAGVHCPEPKFAPDGHEYTFAVNHLGHFLITNLLLGKLKQNTPARIVVVASTEHSSDHLDYENLRHTRHYESWETYRRSKLANILFTYYLAKKLKNKGVTVNCLHPGVVDTHLLRSAFPTISAITVEKGAVNSIYVSSSPGVEGMTGKYFIDRRPVRSSPITYNKEEQKKLWDYSWKVMVDLGYL